jgi:trans-aconitate methyltransferase
MNVESHNPSNGKPQMSDSELKLTFNRSAAFYDEIRPGYCDELIRDVVELSAIPDDGVILEVGCGTGKATRPFAERGYEMVCLDIGKDLISVARQQLRRFSQITFLLANFDAWCPIRQFDLLICATAFHWLNPQLRYKRAAAALGAHGSLAVFSNQHVGKEDGFFGEVQAVYDKYYVSTQSQSGALSAGSDEPGIDAFAAPVRRIYPWRQAYTSEEYIKLLGTYSDHIALPDHNRELLFDGIVDLIDRRYGGTVVKQYEAVLDIRQKKT